MLVSQTRGEPGCTVSNCDVCLKKILFAKPYFTFGSDQTAIIWEWDINDSSPEEKNLTYTTTLMGGKFSKYGTYITMYPYCGSTPCKVVVFDLETLSNAKIFFTTSMVSGEAYTFSDDEKSLFYISSFLRDQFNATIFDFDLFSPTYSVANYTIDNSAEFSKILWVSPDKATLIYGLTKSVVVQSWPSGDIIKIISTNERIIALDVSLNKNLLAYGSTNFLYIYDASTYTEVYSFPYPVIDLDFSEDGSLLTVATNDAYCSIFDTTNWEIKFNISSNEATQVTKFVLEDSIIGCGSYNEIIFVESSTKLIKSDFTLPSNYYRPFIGEKALQMCNKCSTNFMIEDFTTRECVNCLSKIQDCTSCSQDSPSYTLGCNSCTAPKIVSSDKSQCINCNEIITYCSACSQNSSSLEVTCNVCESPKVVDADKSKCVSCNEVIPYCTTCAQDANTFEVTCSLCESPRIVNPTTKNECITCLQATSSTECSSCSQNPTTLEVMCSTCENQKIIDPDNSTNCVNCDDVISDCIDCTQDLNTLKVVCLECGNSKFIEPSKQDSCITCPLAIVDCISCIQDPNTLIISCLDCDNGKFVNPNGHSECLTCGEIIPNCNNCSQNSTDFNVECLACADPLLINPYNHSECVTCDDAIPNCVNCTQDTANYLVECLNCSDPTVINPNNHSQCVNCSYLIDYCSNCTQDSNTFEVECIICSNLRVVNTSDFLHCITCGEAIEDCDTCSQNLLDFQVNCTSCFDDKLVNSNGTACEHQCCDNCEICNVDKKFCEKCFDGYLVNSTGEKCDKTPEFLSDNPIIELDFSFFRANFSVKYDLLSENITKMIFHGLDVANSSYNSANNMLVPNFTQLQRGLNANGYNLTKNVSTQYLSSNLSIIVGYYNLERSTNYTLYYAATLQNYNVSDDSIVVYGVNLTTKSEKTVNQTSIITKLRFNLIVLVMIAFAFLIK